MPKQESLYILGQSYSARTWDATQPWYVLNLHMTLRSVESQNPSLEHIVSLGIIESDRT